MQRFSRLLGLMLVLFLAACASPQKVEDKSFKGPFVWPQPPDQPRFAFEGMMRSPADIYVDTEEDRLRLELTGASAVSDRPAFEKPAAIVARYGRIYVADIDLRQIAVFDIPRRKVFYMGLREPGNLAKPSGLALDDAMKVYVADVTNRKVYVYDSLGLFQRNIGGPEDLDRPTGVAVSRDGERIYVVDRGHNENDQHHVVMYDKEGNKLKVIGSRGDGDGQFNVPLQATVAPDGTLYVLDSGNFRIQAFDREGAFLRKFGGVGTDIGKLARPRGIAVDDEGRVYVTDGAFNNFQIFDPQGQMLLAIGQGDQEDNPGRYGSLNGITVDETGRVYVVDQVFNKVEVIRRLSDSEGQKLVEEAKLETDKIRRESRADAQQAEGKQADEGGGHERGAQEPQPAVKLEAGK